MSAEGNRFQDFFEEGKYVALKNDLYNYLLRRTAIERALSTENCELVLEVGSGISPVMTKTDRIVYSDLSFLACRTLGKVHSRGHHIAADATRLPFLSGTFSHVVCSEVIEHVQDDGAVMRELSRVLRPGGLLLLTFPHRRFYYANDDRFVAHHRRYEIDTVLELLEGSGLRPLHFTKVLGPLEKVLMMSTIAVVEIAQRSSAKTSSNGSPSRAVLLFEPLFRWVNRVLAVLVALDARVMPRAVATCLLIKARKE